MKCVPNMTKTAPISRRSYIPRPLFPSSILCSDNYFVVSWLYSGMLTRCASFSHIRKTAPYSSLEFQFEARTVYRFRVIGVNII